MSHHQLSRWYSQLSTLTRSGIPIPEALRDSVGPAEARREQVAARLLAGDDPREVWFELADIVGKSDALILAAGQLSGRFPEMCDELVREREERGKLRSKLLLGAVYPLILINVVLILSPFIGKVDFSGKNSAGSIGEFFTHALLHSGLNLAVFWLVVGGVVLVAKKRPGFFDPVLRVLPVWGGIMRHTALARLAGTLASLLRAGVGVGDAWELAGDASGDRRLGDAGATIARGVETEREAPGKFLRGMTYFPEDFRSRYIAGEKSGRLEEMLDRIRIDNTASVTARSGVAAVVYPTGFLIVVIGLAAIKVLSFFVGYYEAIINFK